MSTYIVEIDSTYRDIEKYQTQTDFAVSFQTNTSSNYFIQGSPLFGNITGTYYNNFFTKTSIDPDYLNSNLSIQNGVLLDIQRKDQNFYLSGIGYSGALNPFGIRYGSGTVVSLSLNKDSPFICRLLRNVDESYSFQWLSYIDGSFNPSGPLGSNVFSNSSYYSTQSICKVSAQNNIYWMFDSNFYTLDIRVVSTGSTGPVLYSITNPSIYANSINNYIVSFDSNGYYGFVENRPWGYHVLYSNWNMFNLIENGKNGFVLDDAENIFATCNIGNVFYPHFMAYSITGTWIDNTYSILPEGSFICSLTGITGATGGIEKYFLVSIESNVTATLGVPNAVGVYKTGNTLYDFTFVNNISLAILPQLTFSYQYCYVNNKVYLIVSTYSTTISNPYPMYILRLDLYNLTTTLRATTVQTFQNSIFNAVVSGTKIIFCGRTQSPGNTIYVYEFETSTNTLTVRASLVVETSTITDIEYNGCQSTINPLNSNELIIVTQTVSQTSISANLLILSYNITTYSLTLNSTLSTYSKWNYGTFATINSILYYIGSWYVPSAILIVNLSNFSNPFIEGSIDSIPIGLLLCFQKQDPVTLKTNTYLNVGNVVTLKNLLYNINIPSSPYLIGEGIGNYLLNNESSNNLSKGSRLNTLYDPQTQYLFGVSVDFSNITVGASRYTIQGSSVFKTQSILESAQVISSHSTQNLSSSQSLPTGPSYTQLSVLSLPTREVFIFVGNNNQILVYKVLNGIQLLLQNTLTFSSSLSTINGLQTSYRMDNFGNITLFLAASDTTQCLLYYTLYTGSITSWTLISTILPAVILPTNRLIFSYVFSNNQNASIYGYYFIVLDLNNTLRKWSINSNNTITLVSSATPYSIDDPFATAKYLLNYYYENTNQYVLFVYTSSDRYKPVNITEPSDLSNMSSSQYLGAPRKLVITKLSTQQTILSYPPRRNPFYSSGILNISGGGSVLNTPVSRFNLTYILTNFDANGHFGCVNWLDSSTQKSYIAWNSGNSSISPYDNLNIADLSDINSVSVVSQNSIVFPGQVLQMESYQQLNRTVIVSLIDNNSLFLYDVSNPVFAGESQTSQVVSKTYTNLQSNGGSIVHNILNNGIPNWLDVVGTLQDDQMGFLSSISSIVLDDKSDLFITGSWSRRVDFFQTYLASTGTTIVSTYPVNEFRNPYNTIQSYIAKIKVETGKWEWVIPLIGNNSILSRDIGYLTKQSTIISNASFTSQNQYIYKPQLSVSPTGFYPFGLDVLVLQTILNNTSSSSSAVLCIDLNGTLSWTVLLNTLIPQSTVDTTSLYIDESTNDSRVIIAGKSNSTDLIGVDGSNQEIQSLYPSIDSTKQNIIFLYSFGSLSGSYISSQYIVCPPSSINSNNGVRGYGDIDEMFMFNSFVTSIPSQIITAYNKDGSLGDSFSLTRQIPISFVSIFEYDSLLEDFNTFKYSRLFLYGFTGPTGSLTGSLANYNSFAMGYPTDPIVNKNFVIRSSEYDFSSNTMVLTLNQEIKTSGLIRLFSSINGITGSNQYYSSNVSSSPLYDIGIYSTGGVNSISNSITFNTFVNNSTSLDLSKDYYFVFPQQTGSSTYTDIVPITDITYNSSLEQYTMYVENINDLRVPSPSGSLYGPYIYLAQKNYSAFYSLQWYPGARVFSQSYLVGLYDLIIPNRPVRNSRYPGRRFITDYPYLYLVIYNANEEDNFDPSVVNSVYDNNVDVPRFALFQIPTTGFLPLTSDGNYFSATSSATPKIRFTPGFYYLHFKLTDDRGNVILFDNTPYKSTDDIFGDGVVPETLLNMTARLAFKKS